MKKFITSALSFILAINFLLCGPAIRISAEDAEEGYTVREGDYQHATGGNLMMGIKGEFVTIGENEKETILARINEIRKEACDEGVPSPLNKNVKLTPADYVPIKWSKAIELVAAMRAVESSVYLQHGRLSVNQSVWNYGYSVRTHYENVAWNFSRPTVDAILNGIDQWYGEKNEWVTGGDGVTGHYTSMIDPGSKHIGLAGFWNPDGTYRMTVTNQMTSSTGLDEGVAGVGGKVYQKTLVKPAYVTELLKPNDVIIYENESRAITPYAYIGAETVIGKSRGEGFIYEGLEFVSSNESVAKVASDGKLTAGKKGSAVITVKVPGNDVIEVKFRVRVKSLSILWGDANGDGNVTAADVVRLKSHLAAGDGALYIDDGADANGDSVIDALDVVRLKRFFAEYDYSSGASSVKLGK